MGKRGGKARCGGIYSGEGCFVYTWNGVCILGVVGEMSRL